MEITLSKGINYGEGIGRCPEIRRPYLKPRKLRYCSSLAFERNTSSIERLISTSFCMGLWYLFTLHLLSADLFCLNNFESSCYSILLLSFNVWIYSLHSPIGEIFRARLRQFPSLVNCCTIDWFSAWPEEALRSVASTFLGEIPELEDSSAMEGLVCCFKHYVNTKQE